MKRDISIAAMLADFLNRADMTIVRAAAISGLSIGTISKTINGKSKPGRRTAYKLEQLMSDLRSGTKSRRRRN
jgi:hypothetical protein